MNIKIDQLRQLRTLTHDGDLISSSACNQLQKAGLVLKLSGWNFLTAKGVEHLVNLGLAEASGPVYDWCFQDSPRIEETA